MSSSSEEFTNKYENSKTDVYVGFWHTWNERGAFIGENAKRAHGEIYKSHTSVISTQFIDQVQIFFFLTHCIVINVRFETNC